MKRISLKRSNLLGIGTLVLAASFTFAGISSTAQTFCENELVYFSENFGTGTTVSSNPNVIQNGPLEYMATGIMEPDGTYRVADNTQQKPEWHASEDHTPGDVDGRMMVINGAGGDFYQVVVNAPNGFQAGTYRISRVPLYFSQS